MVRKRLVNGERNEFKIEEFKEYFGQFGKIDDFERINDPITGEFKGEFLGLTQVILNLG